MRKMLNDFKEFALRGSVMDMAIGIVIGVAFGTIVTSLVNDIIMPPIGLLLGNIDFSNLFVNMSGKAYASLQDALAAGAPVLRYGVFINTVINFIIIAIVIFFLVRLIQRLKRNEKKPVEVTTKDCPYCVSKIPLKATRCPNCTSQLNP
jgi:large conductance mechanosensitive channel